MNNVPKDTGPVYLPERYRRQIEIKKRRRLIKKFFAFSSAVALCCVLFLIVSGTLSSPQSQPQVLPTESNVSSPEIPPESLSVEHTTPPSQSVTPVIITPTLVDEGIPVPADTEIRSLENATAFLRQVYSSESYRIISVNTTDIFPDRSFTEFKIKDINSPQDDTVFSVFIDTETGDIYSPGQENVTITAEKAKTIIAELFPLIHPDRVIMRYDNNTGSVRAWIFTMVRDNSAVMSGSIDPETGQLLSFTRNISWEGRQADPLIDINVAQKIADRYILEKNSASLHLNMTKVHYIPLQVSQKTVAGHYDFIYNRIVQEIPCDKDGFTISVDSLNGEVTGYDRRWNSPDNAFSVAMDPLVTRSVAISGVLKKAEETYPSSLDGLTIISAGIRWKDDQSKGTIPRPGSIPQAWKVEFTDGIIREKPLPSPAVGWIDIQTGKILDFSYQH